MKIIAQQAELADMENAVLAPEQQAEATANIVGGGGGVTPQRHSVFRNFVMAAGWRAMVYMG